jgi:two-component system CheB/CheR fusion protein
MEANFSTQGVDPAQRLDAQDGNRRNSFEEWSIAARQFELAIPRLFEQKAEGEAIRIWVPGCGRGEEAYALGMLLLEETGRHASKPVIRIFASDIDEQALAVGRGGYFPYTIASAGMDAERLERFFVREPERYRAKRELRDIILFVRHNVLSDPPFSRMDLISSRNFLVHFDRWSRRRVCEAFNFALRPSGFLVLSRSDEANKPPGLFRILDQEANVYGPSHFPKRLSTLLSGWTPNEIGAHDATDQAPGAKAAERKEAFDYYLPASCLVDRAGRALRLSAGAGRYLQPSGGPLTDDIVELAREELRPHLRIALRRALERGEAVIGAPAIVDIEGVQRVVCVQARPLPTKRHGGPAALVFFFEGEAGEGGADEPLAASPETRIREQQIEADILRERLISSRLDYEQTNDELRAVNQSLNSLNEEYRSASRELRLNKEEMLAINAELKAVNQELNLRLIAERQALSDVQNLMAATDVSILFLDNDLRIKKFTPLVTAQFNVLPGDEGRPIVDFTHHFDYDDLADDLHAVQSSGAIIEKEARRSDGGWFLIKLRPYRTVLNKVDGVVMTLIDITERQRAANALRESDARLRSIIDGVGDAIIAADTEGRILWFNRATTDMFGYRGEELFGFGLDMLAPESVRRQHAEIIRNYLDSGKGRVIGIGREIEAQRKDGSVFPAELTVSEIRRDGERLFIGFLRDLSERRRFEARLQRLHENRLSSMANMATELAHEINQPLTAAANYLEAARRRSADQRGEIIPEETRKFMQAATDQVLRAGRIVNRLRQFISRGEPDKKRQSLHALIVTACELVSPMVRAAEVDVTLRLDAQSDQVLVDGVQMEQVFVNLFRNAVDAMDKSAVRRLTVSTRRPDGVIQVEIADTGVGLSGSESSELFLPFTTAKSEGLGVGLSISRAIVEDHYGKMWAVSNSEGGATFAFNLPLAEDEPGLDEKP